MVFKKLKTMSDLYTEYIGAYIVPIYADMVKLVDTSDLGSDTERYAGSNPVIRTIKPTVNYSTLSRHLHMILWRHYLCMVKQPSG